MANGAPYAMTRHSSAMALYATQLQQNHICTLKARYVYFKEYFSGEGQGIRMIYTWVICQEYQGRAEVTE